MALLWGLFKGAAIAGFNLYVATLRQEPADTHFTLTLFNSAG